MTIAIDVTWAAKNLGGISEYTQNLLAALGKLDRKNQYKLVYFYFSPDRLRPLPDLPANFKIIPVRLPSQLYRLMTERAHWPTISHFVGKTDLYYAPHFLAVAPGNVPFIATVHDVAFIKNPKWFTPEDVERFKKALQFCLRNARTIVTISEQSKKDLEEFSRVCPPVVVTPISTTLEEVGNDTVKLLKNLKLKKKQYLLYVGTLEPRKNIGNLLKGYSQYRRASANPLPLILAGRKGWISEEDFAAIKDTAGVRWLGPVDGKTRTALFLGAKALLFVSWYEGFGLPVLEAMHSGVPVVTSNVSSLPEVAGGAALYVDPAHPAQIAKAITKLLENPPLERKMIKDGLKEAKKFTSEKMAHAILKEFEKFKK